jgi:hypothetical protein
MLVDFMLPQTTSADPFAADTALNLNAVLHPTEWTTPAADTRWFQRQNTNSVTVNLTNIHSFGWQLCRLKTEQRPHFICVCGIHFPFSAPNHLIPLGVVFC